MSKVRTDQIEPRVGASIEIGGIDPPTHNGIPLADVDSPTFVGNPTFLGNPDFSGIPTTSTPVLADVSNRLANTSFVSARAQKEITDKLSSITPVMDGTATEGVSPFLARADHIHPSDTSRAAVLDLPVSILITTPGTFTNFFTAPVDGWIWVKMIGGGGGGGAGGADLYGTNGQPGDAFDGSYSCPAGTTLSCIVGTGGVGGSGTATAPGNGAAGTGTFFTRTPPSSTPIVIAVPGGLGGSNVHRSISIGAYPDPYRVIRYGSDSVHGMDIVVSITPDPVAGQPMSNPATSSLDVPNHPSSNVLLAEFSSNPSGLIPKDSQYGAAGCGAPAARMEDGGAWVDPIFGYVATGSANPNAITGGRGGHGVIYVRFFAGSTTIGSAYTNTIPELDLLRLELHGQGIKVTDWRF